MKSGVSKQALVCDTSVLLYLGRIGRADLLPALFEPVYVPHPVALELSAERLLRPDTLDPQTLAWVTSVAVVASDVEALPPNRLGPGERAVLACARAYPGCWVGLDDRQARLLAEALGLAVVGTVGILLKAKQAGLIPMVRQLLDAAQTEGFRLDADVYMEALRLAGEGTPE